MKRTTPARLIVATTVVLAGLSVSGWALDDSAGINVTPPSALAWQETPEGVSFAALDGNRFAEAYMAMVRLPAGLSSPVHTKSAAMYGIVVRGTFVHRQAGRDPADDVQLPPGSFYRIPAGVPHVSACVSEVACETFLYQDGKFDFNPVESD